MARPDAKSGWAPWHAFRAIARKELWHISRNGFVLRFQLLIQIIDIVMLGFINVTVRHTPLVIVDQDQSVVSRQLIQQVAATGSFRVERTTTSVEQARALLRAGIAHVALQIPPDFARNRAAGRRATVLALVDGSDQVASSQALLSLDGLANEINADAVSQPLDPAVKLPTVHSHPLLLFNPEADTARFMLPALLAVMMIGFVQMAAESLLSERGSGNLERLLMTPMSYTGLILGKIAPYVGMGVANGLLYLLVMRFGFGVPIQGDLLLLTLAIVLYTFTVIALGIWLASSSESGGVAQLWITILVITTFSLSGYFFPVSSFPWPLRIYSYALPPTHMIEVMRGICLRGAGFRDLLPYFLYLIVAPVAFTVLAARRFAASVRP